MKVEFGFQKLYVLKNQFLLIKMYVVYVQDFREIMQVTTYGIKIQYLFFICNWLVPYMETY